MGDISSKEFLDFLLERFKIERDKFDRSGVYAYTQRLLAYNSNKIEGSTLTEEQTASLFDNGTLPKADNYYRAKDVEEMNSLMDWYGNQNVDISVLAEFHARYESIHPFQDGNGRTGRLILFRECLKNGIIPVVIEDTNRNLYLDAFREYREEKKLDKFIKLFVKEQQFYLGKCRYFM